MEEDTIFEFDSPKESSSYIKVIGVGGGGSNAVNHMYSQGIKGVDFIVCNTDEKALNQSPVSNKIALDRLGAGNNPAVARAAAEKNADTIREVLSHNTQMLFITAGMGGGTGTGASPVIAQIAKSIDLDDDITGKILVVAIVTMPFSFEGRKRKEQAEAGIAELRKYVDSILVINNDKLRAFGDQGLSGAFALANDVLLTAAKGIAEIITSNALVSIDFRDVNTVMHNSGTALMGAGQGTGQNRAMDAIQAATTSVLLNDNDISGAKDALLYISYGRNHEVSMDELASITDYVESLIKNQDCTIIWGYGEDETLDEEIKITIIATGFEKKSLSLPPSDIPAHKQPIVLEEPKPEPKPAPVAVENSNTDEMHIIHHEPEPIATPKAETTVVPETPKAEAPIQKLEPDATVISETIVDGHVRRIFGLGSTEEINVATEAPEVNSNFQQHTGDAHYTEGIHLITPEERTMQTAPEPKVAERPAATATIDPFASLQQAQAAAATLNKVVEEKSQHITYTEPVQVKQGQMDQRTVEDRSDRIKRIYEMLHQPNGPQMVEDLTLTPSTGLNNAVPTSHISESKKSTINADGTISDMNSYLYDNPD